MTHNTAALRAPGAFETNGFFERLGSLRATDPCTFNSLSPASKLALFEYEKQKRGHERWQAIKAEALRRKHDIN
jgi:hypothetical protein